MKKKKQVIYKIFVLVIVFMMMAMSVLSVAMPALRG